MDFENTYILKEAITSIVKKKKSYGKRNEAIKIIKPAGYTGKDNNCVDMFIAESLITKNRFIVRMSDVIDTGVELKIKEDIIAPSNKYFPLPKFEKMDIKPISEAIVNKIGKGEAKKNLIKKIQTKMF